MAKRFGVFLGLALVVAFGWMGIPAAQAGNLILEGSDAIGYHCEQTGNASACAYRDQAWSARGGAAPPRIPEIGEVLQGSGTHPVDIHGSRSGRCPPG